MDERREIEALDEEIIEATLTRERPRALELHARRYEWLRHHYLTKQGDAATTVLEGVRGVVLTVDLAIKILGRMSRKHTSLLSKPVVLGIVDEVQNVSRDQLLCLAAHIKCLIAAGTRSRNSGGC